MKRVYLLLFLCVNICWLNAQCNVENTPYFENFSTVTTPTIPPCMTVENTNGDVSIWRTGLAGNGSTNQCGVYMYDVVNSANDWLFTPMISSGGKYRLSFKYGCRSATFPERLEVAFGYSPSSSSMTNTLATFHSITNAVTDTSGFITFVIEFVPINTFCVGFHAISLADQWDLYIDDISITKISNGISIFNDFNENCLSDSSESQNNSNIALTIQPGNYNSQSTNGYWSIDSLPPGTYTATVDTSGSWKATCSPSVSFTVVHPDSFVQVTPIGMKNINPCTEPEISIMTPVLRRCFTNQNIYLEAKNLSTATQVMYNSYADVKLDPFLTVTSATRPYSTLGNNIYRFQLDSLYPGQSKSWNISTTVSCSTTLGQTLCMDAKIFPVSPCVLDSTPTQTSGVSPCLGPWDKSSLGVEGTCVGDSIRFVIENHGVFGNGDMDCFMPIRIYANGVLTTLDSLKIVGGDSLVIMIPADGRTWRLEADQHPLHPGNSHPNATVDACGDSLQLAQNWTPGTVNIMPLNDADPVIDIYCGVVSGSYDPNDKTGYPTGVTNNHYILKNQQLQYVIRFQNTGTDTAFTVVIRDTLETDLNIFSVKTGVSSHNYSFRMYGPRVLEWTFNNIMLPDSFHSEPNSHGFVTFTVEQIENLPNGTLIENSAAIYFDFNDPVITNKSQHTIIETWPLITSVSDLNNLQQPDIQVYPNPTEDKLHVVSSLPSSIKLLDLTGRLLKNMPNLKTSHELNLSEFPAGIYLLEVEVNGKIEVKKIVRR